MSFTTSASESIKTAPHTHCHGKCPITGNTHEFCPPQAGDVRSPCPALNTLANHGYIPRNGKHIKIHELVDGLKKGFHLSSVLAHILAIGAVWILGQFRSMSLSDLARHNLIEHDASLVHDDDLDESEYASTKVDPTLLEDLCEQAGQVLPNRITTEDVARIRVKREAVCRRLDTRHAEIARGEMAVALGVLGGADADKAGVEIETLHFWLKNERLPVGWSPSHTQGLLKTIRMTSYIRHRMAQLKAQSAPPAPVKAWL
ncbi:Cloroperoxidase [Leucogyrophana mollusca]|uniref:Cloroperoxidase n=1 Tax=Leucogyrophana mollusca TaxID=85980 RepID=A0ACB8BD59_9AGAM|nr:Cloroperoxidase [Leucogyrophana mollusca]